MENISKTKNVRFHGTTQLKCLHEHSSLKSLLVPINYVRNTKKGKMYKISQSGKIHYSTHIQYILLYIYIPIYFNYFNN